MVKYFLVSSLRIWEYMNAVIASLRYFAIFITAAFQSGAPSASTSLDMQ